MHSMNVNDCSGNMDISVILKGMSNLDPVYSPLASNHARGRILAKALNEIFCSLRKPCNHTNYADLILAIGEGDLWIDGPCRGGKVDCTTSPNRTHLSN